MSDELDLVCSIAIYFNKALDDLPLCRSVSEVKAKGYLIDVACRKTKGHVDHHTDGYAIWEE